MSTYTPIATQTLASAAPSVTFSSIPQGYTDLVLVTTANVSANGYTKLYFNNVTTATYSMTNLSGNGSTPNSARQPTSSGLGYTQIHYLYTDSNRAILKINLQNYSNSTTFKSFLIREDDATYELTAKVGLWQSTNPITSLTLERVTGNWTSGSTFSIYGIQVGDKAQKAQGGNIVTSDGTYVYHTFTSSGAFIPNEALTCDYLVVAGGGGGNSVANSGGGGAGGMRCTVNASGGSPGTVETALSLTAKSYPVIVGAGGARDVSGYNSGSNSVFATITSTGGGGGGAGLNGTYGVGTGNNGGSGGGAGTPVETSVTNSGGTGTTNQGYAGGTSTRGANAYGGAGGGGAGAVGSNGSGTSGGAGGNGVATSISGTSTTYAGGGGGGHNESSSVAGGTGGGGTGGRNGASAGAGTPNTGSGGGGGGSANTVNNGIAAAGGSGIVIIRYLA